MTKDELAALVKSELKADGERLVFGEGPLRARVMLIGEAPGEKEEAAGRPFVGKAGSNLDSFLKAVSLDRSLLYVTNAVKIRPVRVSAAGNTVNRPPTAREVALFLPFLLQEIGEVAPSWIVTLGNTPLRALMGKDATVGKMHGVPVPFRSHRLYPMYHPASLIYDRSLSDVYAADMERLAQLLRSE